MISVLLGLGSNTNFSGMSSLELLASACKKLSLVFESPAFSCIYESKAMYVENQNNFFNMVVRLKVPDQLSPYALLEEIHKIENEFGRDRSKEIRFGPRPLDIDIEEFGSLVLDDPVLTIPHPRIAERQFVLIPALEILKESADSKLRETLNSYLKSLSPQGVEKCPENTQILFRKLLEGGCYGNKTC